MLIPFKALVSKYFILFISAKAWASSNEILLRFSCLPLHLSNFVPTNTIASLFALFSSKYQSSQSCTASKECSEVRSKAKMTPWQSLKYIGVKAQNLSYPAVSQIISLILSPPSTSSILVANSTPIVVYVPSSYSSCISLFTS